jgi:RHS repeat-associated protein
LERLRINSVGNVTTGLDGKLMSYDGENRLTEITFNGVTTCYVYGPDGTRWKMITDCGGANEQTTAYYPHTEIRNFGEGASEEIYTYPLANIRLKNGNNPVYGGDVAYLHSDAQNSVVAMSDAAGNWTERRAYKPFGEQSHTQYKSGVTPIAGDAHGYIGERNDADAGLQYLNARYYDTRLGLFTQADWFDVRMAGVGTNRFAYSGNDPINAMDPGGNGFWESVTGTKFKDTNLGKSLQDSGNNFKDHFSKDRNTRQAAVSYNVINRQAEKFVSYGEYKAAYLEAGQTGVSRSKSSATGQIGTGTFPAKRKPGLNAILGVLLQNAYAAFTEEEEGIPYYHYATIASTTEISVDRIIKSGKRGTVYVTPFTYGPKTAETVLFINSPLSVGKGRGVTVIAASLDFARSLTPDSGTGGLGLIHNGSIREGRGGAHNFVYSGPNLFSEGLGLYQ